MEKLKINPCTCGEMPKELQYSGQCPWDQIYQIACPKCGRCIFTLTFYRHEEYQNETIAMWNNGTTGGYRQNFFGNLEEDR